MPYVDGELGYFVYEEVKDQSQSSYLWWHANGLGGCILKPHLRLRLGLPRQLRGLPEALFGDVVGVTPGDTDIAGTDGSATAADNGQTEESNS